MQLSRSYAMTYIIVAIYSTLLLLLMEDTKVSNLAIAMVDIKMIKPVASEQKYHSFDTELFINCFL